MKNLNRYVKVKGHNNWFLVLEAGDNEPSDFSEIMQEKIIRSEVCALHNPQATMDFKHRVILAATKEINYENLAQKYGTILIRPIGSFMPLYYNEITEEVFDTDFPIEDYAKIVICENDRKAEHNWVKYLEKRFTGEKIITINYFDLRSEEEIKKYFEEAEYITFSTTFTNFEWFKKLTKFIKNKHKVIGYCHDYNNWEEAKKIYSKIEIIKEI